MPHHGADGGTAAWCCCSGVALMLPHAAAVLCLPRLSSLPSASLPHPHSRTSPPPPVCAGRQPLPAHLRPLQAAVELPRDPAGSAALPAAAGSGTAPAAGWETGPSCSQPADWTQQHCSPESHDSCLHAFRLGLTPAAPRPPPSPGLPPLACSWRTTWRRAWPTCTPQWCTATSSPRTSCWTPRAGPSSRISASAGCAGEWWRWRWWCGGWCVCVWGVPCSTQRPLLASSSSDNGIHQFTCLCPCPCTCR